jgi:hypothetical protein
MTSRSCSSITPRTPTRVPTAVLVAAALIAAVTSDATAACIPTERARPAVAAPNPGYVQGAIISSGDHSSAGHSASIVGLWKTTFLAGDGPDVAYEGFQQWHVGGTEVMVDNGVSPAFGNVCVGVWKQVAARTYRLRHVTFNWDAQGRPAGTFVMQMTVTLDRRGNRYSGRYVADSFDLSGTVIPELHLEGTVRSVRIAVE